MNKIVYIGNGIGRYTIQTGERISFFKNQPTQVSSKDFNFLLKVRGKGCRCHNNPAPRLYMSFDEWKEERVL